MKRMKNWLDEGWFGIRRGYLLRHPWEILPKWGHRIKWAWQRVFRGWDDRVVWGIDCYLAKHMPNWLEVLRGKGCVPCQFVPRWDASEEEMEVATRSWHKTIHAISDGFVAAGELAEAEYPIDYDDSHARYHKGMRLFVEHFHSLWY